MATVDANYCFVLILPLLLAACASNQWNPSEVDEIFVTDIKSSGLKIFNYSLTMTTPQASGSGERRGGSNGKGSGKHSGRGGNGSGYGGKGGGKSADESSMKPYFNEMLESKLKESGYCREGYIELNSYFGKGQLKIRGECEEGATEEDRIKYVNNENI